MNTAVNDRSDCRERWIDAPPEAVFAAFSDPQRLARWWGPAGFTNTFVKFDFHPGGDWHFTMHGPDGADHWNECIFREVVTDQRLVIEHFPVHHFFLTLTCTPQDGGTLVGWLQTFDTEAHYRKLAAFVAKANEENLDRLEREVRAGIAS